MEGFPFWLTAYLLLLAINFGYSKPALKEPKECKEPLGIQTGFLEDRDIKTSSAQKNFTVSDAWCASQTNDKQFFAVDLGEDFLFTKVATQGKVDDKNRFVKSYELQFSDDNKKWKPYLSDGKQILDGNKDTFTVKYHKLESDAVGRYVKLVPKTWNNGICSRLELYGCAVDDVKRAQAKNIIKTPIQAPDMKDIIPDMPDINTAKDVKDIIPGLTIPKDLLPDAKTIKDIVPEVKKDAVPVAKNTKDVPKRDSEATWNFAAAAEPSQATAANAAASAAAADNDDLLELSRQLGTPSRR